MQKLDDKINNEEYITLKEKYDILEGKYSKIQDRVTSLEKNIFDLLMIEIHNIQRDANEKENEDSMVVDELPSPSNIVKRKAGTSDLQLEEKRNKLSDVTIVSDDEMEDNEEYDLENSRFHEILDNEYDISQYLTIRDIRDNLQVRI